MINIQDIIPFMEKGWVAMDKCGAWYWHASKPEKFVKLWDSEYSVCLSDIFDLKPVKNWKKSVISIGEVENDNK